MAEDQNKKYEGMRTFYRDLQKLETQYQNGILRSVLQEQQYERKREAVLKRRRKMSLVWLIAALVLIFGGIATVFISERLSVPTPPEQGPELPSLFPMDYNIKLSLQSDSLAGDVANLATQSYISPSMVRIVPEHGRIASLKEAGEILWPNMPLLVTTSVYPDFVWGYHTESGEQTPFLVLQARDFSGTREGMRFWEQTLYNDLLVAFNLPTQDITAGSFQDELINNIPARSYYMGTIIEETEIIRTPIIVTPPEVSTSSSSTIATTTEPVIRYEEETIITRTTGPSERLFFYTIVNASYVIITTSPDTVTEIVNRLAQQ